MLCGGHDTTQDRRAARGTWPHPSASGVLASLPLRVLLVITPSSVLPLPFHFIHLALRRTTTSLWYVPRARRYTGASSVATLSRASPPFWNECFLRSHSSPSSTKTIPHLARTACFIIILLIIFVMIRRLITAYFVTPTLFARSSAISRITHGDHSIACLCASAAIVVSAAEFLFLKVVYEHRLHFPLQNFHASEQLVILCTSFASQVQCALRGT